MSGSSAAQPEFTRTAFGGLLAPVAHASSCAYVDVVVDSSSDNPADREFARVLRTDKFFHKPTDLEDFLKLGDVVAAHLASYESDHSK